MQHAKEKRQCHVTKVSFYFYYFATLDFVFTLDVNTVSKSFYPAKSTFWHKL